MSDKMREEFEKWHAGRMLARGHDNQDVASEFDLDENGDYVYWEAADGWLIWQASRAALVVELPPLIKAGEVYDAFGMDDTDAQDCANMVNGAIGSCAAFIHAAGVKTA